MANPNVVEFTTANFDNEVLASKTPVVVDFWAEWCAPCKLLGPTIDQLAEEFKGKVKVGKLNTEHNRDIAVKFEIQGIPTVLIFKDGAIVNRIMGLRPKAEFVNALSKL
ncbi:MAG: thioredoxin [Phycisphaerales bacterium]